MDVKTATNRRYLAFMVRFTRDEADNRWRASLEDANTGERQHFPDEQALLLFIRDRLTQTPTNRLRCNQES